MEVKKVLFYIHNYWVFGKIHNELIKALYPDVYCDILCWQTAQTDEELVRITDKYDLVVTTPDSAIILRNRGVSLGKVVAVAHASWDIFNALYKEGMTPANFTELAGYAAVCPTLQHISLSHGIGRLPEVLPIGLFQANYPRNTANFPSRVGHFSSFSRSDNGFDLKRGSLVKDIAEKSGIEYIHYMSANFLRVEQLYKDTNLVINPSLMEGNPYPILEALACGIPCISTPTGIAQEYLRSGGGILLPLDAEDFVYKATYEIAKMLKGDNRYYRQLADESYEIGKTIDWSNIREKWINYINKL